jgi:hypothetical protein
MSPSSPIHRRQFSAIRAAALCALLCTSNGTLAADRVPPVIHFHSPTGWAINDQESHETRYVFRDHAEHGLLLVFPSTATSLDMLRSSMIAGLRDGADSSLTLIGDLHDFADDGVEAEFEGMIQWLRASAFGVGRATDAGGVIVVAAAAHGKLTPAQRDAARRLAASAAFGDARE